MLAYLICKRGATATGGEIASALFEDAGDPQKVFSYIRKLTASLKKALGEYGLENAVLHTRNSYAVDTGLIKCDYWDYLDDTATDLYYGEFMNQYSWAEKYIYQLELKKHGG